MTIHQFTQIGAFHLHHNEDAHLVAEIEEDKILIAVLDGCSMGKESHFASTLMVKLLRKIAKFLYYRAFVESCHRSAAIYLREILQRLFLELRQLKQQLTLTQEEVLSTLMIGVLDRTNREVELCIIGDGFICCNCQWYDYDQGDRPDYLGYHLSKDFNTWY